MEAVAEVEDLGHEDLVHLRERMVEDLDAQYDYVKSVLGPLGALVAMQTVFQRWFRNRVGSVTG